MHKGLLYYHSWYSVMYALDTGTIEGTVQGRLPHWDNFASVFFDLKAKKLT